MKGHFHFSIPLNPVIKVTVISVIKDFWGFKMRIHWISSPNLSKSRRQGCPVRSYISLFSRVRESPHSPPDHRPRYGDRCDTFWPSNSFLQAVREKVEKTSAREDGQWLNSFMILLLLRLLLLSYHGLLSSEEVQRNPSHPIANFCRQSFCLLLLEAYW